MAYGHKYGYAVHYRKPAVRKPRTATAKHKRFRVQQAAAQKALEDIRTLKECGAYEITRDVMRNAIFDMISDNTLQEYISIGALPKPVNKRFKAQECIFSLSRFIKRTY